MSVNPSAMHFRGAVLCWLGIVLGVVAIALFVVSGGATPFSSTITTIDATGGVGKSIVCGVSYVAWMPRLVYLLPLLAGIPLVVAGVRIRKSIVKSSECVVGGNGG
jgi:hypothetical protein